MSSTSQATSLDQVRELIYRLYDPTTPSHLHAEIQQVLQSYQKSIGWSGVFEILNSGNETENVYFFAALSLQNLIISSWNTLSDDEIEMLRVHLLGWTKRFATSTGLVARKLSQALGSFVIRSSPDKWKGFIEDIINAYGNDELGLTLTLDFLSLIPEQVSRSELVTTKKVQLEQELRDAVPKVSILLASILTVDTSTKLRRTAIECLQSWITHVFSQDVVIDYLPVLISHITKEDVGMEAIEVLIEMIGLPGLQSLAKSAIFNNILIALTSDWARNILQTARENQDCSDPHFNGIVRLATTFGETFADELLSQIPNTSMILTFLEEMLLISEFPGQYPIDEDVSILSFSFWCLYSESLCDSQLMAGKPNELELAKSYLRKLSQIIKQKCMFSDTLWTKDTRDRFNAYRREAGDVLVNIYYVLRDELIGGIMDDLEVELNKGNFCDIESSLFCLHWVAEGVPLDENQHIPRLFSHLIVKIPLEAPIRVKRGALYVIGGYSDWLQLHPEHLIPSLNFLVHCLSESTLASIASISLRDVCDACRHNLVTHVDALVNMYISTTTMNVEIEVRCKIIEAVSFILQAISPPESAIGPLTLILSDTIKALQSELNRDRLIDLISLMEACAKGIQPPSNEPYVIEANTVEQVAQTKATSISAIELSQTIGVLLQSIHERFGLDEGVMDGLCQFLRATIRISASHLLAPSVETLIELVGSGFEQSGFACWLDVAAHLVSVGVGYESSISRLMNMVIGLCMKLIEDMERYPDVMHSMFTFYEKLSVNMEALIWGESGISDGNFNLIESMVRMGIRGISMQEKLALKAAVNFMTVACQKIPYMYMGMIIHEILVGIIGGLPRSSLPLISGLLYKISKSYPRELPILMREQMILLEQEQGNKMKARTEDVRKFIDNVCGARSPARLRESVNTFAAITRGSF